MQGKVVWLTGLPGSGKSTVADAVKQLRPHIVILRMDELRKVVTPVPTYSEEEREMVYRCIVYLAAILSGLGHDVIIDATGNLRRWRDLARELIPSFAEV
ncbi:MAG: adenylyl-sulfate kinase, partial [Nitrospirae bacterium]|nr:adenylyl-sulfate kinase [Nitrospirota bacterium]